MIGYIIQKLAYGLAVLAGIICIVFFLFSVLPGDAAQMTMGQRADVQSLESVRKELGLDKSKGLQFLYFVNDISPIGIHPADATTQAKYHYLPILKISSSQVLVLKRPYLRRSYQTKREVSDILAETIPNTLVLAFGSMVFATIIGLSLGILAALKQHTWIDKLAIGVSIIGISAPSFFAGIIIAWLFGYVLNRYTGLNMTGSLFNYDPFNGQVLSLQNLVLPLLTLGLRPLAIIVQLTRSSLLDVLSQDYIRTAKAKGLTFYKVLVKHALKNALNPVVTAISGWFAGLMAGAVLVERIFSWKGIGNEVFEALSKNDLPVVMGFNLGVCCFLCGNKYFC